METKTKMIYDLDRMLIVGVFKDGEQEEVIKIYKDRGMWAGEDIDGDVTISKEE